LGLSKTNRFWILEFGFWIGKVRDLNSGESAANTRFKYETDGSKSEKTDETLNAEVIHPLINLLSN
jgi:hypothetical protein